MDEQNLNTPVPNNQIPSVVPTSSNPTLNKKFPQRKWLIIASVVLILILISTSFLIISSNKKIDKEKENIESNTDSTLESLKRQQKEIEEKIANLANEAMAVKSMDDYKSYSEKSSKLYEEYDRIKSEISKMLVANVGEINTQDVYNKFCVAEVNINYKNTDYSFDYTLELKNIPIEKLTDNLMNDIYLDNQIPEALSNLGLKLIQGGKNDDGISFYKCSAEKYYDMVAMYRMAQIYREGTEAIKKSFPGSEIKNNIEKSPQQELFWLLSFLYVQSVEKYDPSVFYNYRTSVITMIDNRGENQLTEEEEAKVENDVLNFIKKRYPEIEKLLSV